MSKQPDEERLIRRLTIAAMSAARKLANHIGRQLVALGSGFALPNSVPFG